MSSRVASGRTSLASGLLPVNATRSIRSLGRPACLAVSLFCWVAAAVPAVRAQAVADEFHLKAAFIYRFPQFVEWPLPALKGRQTLDLCVLSPNPFGDALEELVDGETVNGVPLSVRQVDGGTSLATCPVLFLPAAAPDRRAVLRQLANQPVLTIGDSPKFIEDGGIVQLRVVDRRVRFDINTRAASRAGLHLSAQLLRLALNVRGGTS
jgi:hypothetical protein